jgi:hypothetical protein
MPFEKGHKQGKGRPKGAENKVIKEARQVFLETLEGQSEHIAEAFEKVRKESPSKYLDLFAKYAQYFVPKKSQADIDLKGDIITNIVNLGKGVDPNETTK